MTKLDNSSMNYDEMEIISEEEIPLDASPEDIHDNLVIGAKYLGGYKSLNDKLDTLKKQKKTVMDWFQGQQEAIEKQQDFLKSKIEEALYVARQNGEAKPKIKTWAGTAYYQSRTKFDWNNHSNTSQEIIKLAKKHNVEIEVIEKTNLSKLKQHLTKEDLKILGASAKTVENVVIRKS